MLSFTLNLTIILIKFNFRLINSIHCFNSNIKVTHHLNPTNVDEKVINLCYLFH